MVADDLRLYMRGINTKMLSEMDAKAQAVEEGARAQYTIVTGRFARDVGERIGWIGDRDQHCFRSGAHNLRNNVSIDRSVLFQQPQPPLRIVAVRSAARLLVDARSDQHHAGAGKRVVITVPDINLRRKRRAVAEVGRYGLRRLAGAVDQHDFTRAATRYRRECNGAADISGADNAEFHGSCRSKSFIPACSRGQYTNSWLNSDYSRQPLIQAATRAGGAMNSGPTGSAIDVARIRSISVIAPASIRQPITSATGAS